MKIIPLPSDCMLYKHIHELPNQPNSLTARPTLVYKDEKPYIAFTSRAKEDKDDAEKIDSSQQEQKNQSNSEAQKEVSYDYPSIVVFCLDQFKPVWIIPFGLAFLKTKVTDEI